MSVVEVGETFGQAETIDSLLAQASEYTGSDRDENLQALGLAMRGYTLAREMLFRGDPAPVQLARSAVQLCDLGLKVNTSPTFIIELVKEAVSTLMRVEQLAAAPRCDELIISLYDAGRSALDQYPQDQEDDELHYRLYSFRGLAMQHRLEVERTDELRRAHSRKPATYYQL